MNQFLIRYAQAHESFRKPELEALAAYEHAGVAILDYDPASPFCVVEIRPHADDERPPAEVARSLISRSILSRGIYEFWGRGCNYDLLHEDIQTRCSGLWLQYKHVPFRFSMDSFCGKRSLTQQREIINTFRYMSLEGKISMKAPEVEFTVFEEWEEATILSHDPAKLKHAEEAGTVEKRQPKRLFFGRFLGGTRRHLCDKHDLKKRPYISTTSMDAELALVTVTLALAGPGKICLDPFVGTGGFMVAASELGALTFGADIDGRSFRGKGSGLENGVGANFDRYGLGALFGDCFTSDLVNTPLRLQYSQTANLTRWLDCIVSDPPYGVREGLKVLGVRNAKLANAGISNTDGAVVPAQPHYIDGVLAHTLPGYIAPKKPYSFTRMLDNILDFAARTLIDGGRLAFWMPSANELDQELELPKHPLLVLKHVCVQSFNKWSRRLLVYERVEGDVAKSVEAILNGDGAKVTSGMSADELNPFRKMYFKGFQAGEAS